MDRACEPPTRPPRGELPHAQVRVTPWQAQRAALQARRALNAWRSASCGYSGYAERLRVAAGMGAVVVPLAGTFRPTATQHPLWSDPQVVAWRVAAGQSRRV